MDTDSDVILAIDLGTSGLKVAHVALSGEVRSHAHRHIPTRVLPAGGAVQDPKLWWELITSAVQEVGAADPASASGVVAVAVTGEWGSTVPVDGAGQSAGEAMLWLDQRGGELAAAQLGGRLNVSGYRPRVVYEWIRRSGGGPSPEGNDPLGHRLWIRHQEPDVYSRTAVFLEPVDYVNLRLTGQVAATQASMTLSWLTDNRRLDALAYDPVLLRLSGTDPDKLPPLRPIRSVIGEVTAGTATELGIPVGVPVVSALPDLHSTALGSGALGSGQGHVSLSTSAWVGVHDRRKKTSLAHQMATVPSALPGMYVLANNHDSAGSALGWLREKIIAVDDGLGNADPALSQLDSLAATVPAGANGVLFTPWLKGLRCPVSDTSMRAGFMNIDMETTRADLVRAVLEGVAHQVRWLAEASSKMLGDPLRKLRIVGGGAQSAVWCQIHADVLGREMQRVSDPLYAGVRGIAMFAGVVTGRLEVADVARRILVDKVYSPNQELSALYGQRHREFVRLASAQQKMYDRLGA